MSLPPAPIRAEGQVVSLRDEGGSNRRLVLSVSDWPGFEPGQFVMLSAGARGSASRCDPLLPRPMAVYRESAGAAQSVQGPASARLQSFAGAHALLGFASLRGRFAALRAARRPTLESASLLEILFKVHGRGTALLADVRSGEHVGVVGPLGTPFPDPPEGIPALIVAGGTGIASVYGLAARLRERGRAVSILLGARSALDLMGEADFAALDLDLAITTEDGSRGRRGLVTDLLGEALAGAGDAWVYACGPTPMMAAAAGIAARRGCACWVSLENPMACGFGVCLGCAAPLRDGGFALVCRDGPVLSAASVAWERSA